MTLQLLQVTYFDGLSSRFGTFEIGPGDGLGGSGVVVLNFTMLVGDFDDAGICGVAMTSLE